jgi:hypothetical protein
MSTDFRAIRPGADEHIEYYGRYISQVPDGDIVATLERQLPETISFLRSIPESRIDYRYAPGKWTPRQIVGHLSDGERVFQYRAWRFSRADTTPVPGFEENDYVDNAPFESVSMSDLLDEFEQMRKATVHMFRNMDEHAMSLRGTANGAEVSVRAIAWIIAGHETHHLKVLREKYLKD